MKKIFVFSCLMLAISVGAQAANEKIDPTTYICAELITKPMTDGGQPPIFEALQIDGFASAKGNVPVADPETLAPLLGQVYAACQAKPTDKVVTVWEQARKALPAASDGPWRADKTTCKDYAANPEDGSGFVVWLDGYNRGKSGKPASVLNSDESLKAYFDACAQKPEELMLGVMAESAK